MEVRRINFIFENCEIFSVGIEDIEYFYLSEVQPSHYIAYENGILSTKNFAGKFAIKLYKRANINYECMGRSQKIFSRFFEYIDLMRIELITDEEEYVYNLAWKGNETNSFETVLRASDGGLCVLVAKDCRAEDIFAEELNEYYIEL